MMDFSARRRTAWLLAVLGAVILLLDAAAPGSSPDAMVLGGALLFGGVIGGLTA